MFGIQPTTNKQGWLSIYYWGGSAFVDWLNPDVEWSNEKGWDIPKTNMQRNKHGIYTTKHEKS